MQQVVLEIPNIEENIARPVVSAVVRDLSQKLGIPDTTKIRFIGSGTALPLSGTSLDDKNTLGRLPGDQYITIDASEEYDENNAMSVAVYQKEIPAFFRDDKLGVMLKPVYQRITNSITIKCVATDKTTADNWVSTIKRRFSQRVVENIHVAEYSFPIPPTFVAILVEIHRLRENNKGYGEDIGKWLNNCFVNRQTTITDQAGNNPKIVVREKQIQIMGWFDFTDQPPKVQKEGDTGTWSIEFTYQFGYDRVESMVMRYPFMVHNQLLTNRYYDDVPVEDYHRILRFYSNSRDADTRFVDYPSGLETIVKQGSLSIPTFDTWKPSVTPNHYVTFLKVMLQVDKHNPKAIMSLTQLGDWKLADDLIRFLRQRPRTILMPYNNIINIQLYRGNQLMDCNRLIISEDLDIHYSDNLDERSVYHLSISALINVYKLDAITLANLAKEGLLFLRYLIATVPMVRNVFLKEGYRFDEFGNIIDKNGNIVLPANMSTSNGGSVLDSKGNLIRLPNILPDGSLNLFELKETLYAITIKPSHQPNDFSWRLISSLTVQAGAQ